MIVKLNIFYFIYSYSYSIASVHGGGHLCQRLPLPASLTVVIVDCRDIVGIHGSKYPPQSLLLASLNHSGHFRQPCRPQHPWQPRYLSAVNITDIPSIPHSIHCRCPSQSVCRKYHRHSKHPPQYPLPLSVAITCIKGSTHPHRRPCLWVRFSLPVICFVSDSPRLHVDAISSVPRFNTRIGCIVFPRVTAAVPSLLGAALHKDGVRRPCRVLS